MRIDSPANVVGPVLLTREMATVRTSMRPVTVGFELPSPYDADSLLDFLSHRVVAGIESVDGRTYSRSLRLPCGHAAMRLVVGDKSVDGRMGLSDPADGDA